MNRWERALLRKFKAELYVLGLYREVLGREPTVEECELQVRQLRIKHLAESAVKILRTFLNSAEASSALGPRLLGRTHLREAGNEEPVSYVVSFGPTCYTSSMLARHGLKRFSGPFDWLFSSLGMIDHCLRDDFRTFLDRQYYSPVALDQRRDGGGFNVCEHDYYLKQFGIRYVFNHTDPSTDMGYAYLTRCVERLRAVMAAPERKLFVCVTQDVPELPHSLNSLCQVLKLRAGRFDLLCITVERPNASALLPTLSRSCEIAGADFYALQPISGMVGTRFEDPLDELPIARLLARFPMALKPIELVDGKCLPDTAFLV